MHRACSYVGDRGGFGEAELISGLLIQGDCWCASVHHYGPPSPFFGHIAEAEYFIRDNVTAFKWLTQKGVRKIHPLPLRQGFGFVERIIEIAHRFHPHSMVAGGLSLMR